MTTPPRGPAFYRSPLFWQYLLLAVLFLRTIWGMWDIRDMTTGDTSSYYPTALDFARHLTCNIAWSPLYTSYFGAFHWFSGDPFVVLIAHRIGILAILTVLIFEVSRRLLVPTIAWFITAWWLLLPINFNALYEVHLFALIPILIFWLLLAMRPSLWMRGICIGLLAVTTILVRNEMLLVLGTFTVVSVAFDIWQIWRKQAAFRPVRYLAAYVVPVAVACLIIGLFYWRSNVKYPALDIELKGKHTLNISQIYCFGYSQRHPEYTDDPWVGYAPLMVRDFGNELPTMREAIQANPKAMFEHFWWNAQLIPSGLQVALFNCRAGADNPDYASTAVNKPLALSLSAAYLALVACGVVLVARNFRFWWDYWLARRAWVIFAILSVCSTVCVVMIMQRPRPSYMFAQSLALMWLAGFSLQVLLYYLPRARAVCPVCRKVAIVAMLAAAFLTPRYYVEARLMPNPKNVKSKKALRPRTMGARPLLSNFRLLEPYRQLLSREEGKAGTGGYPFELNSYFGFGGQIIEKRFVDTMALIQKLAPADSLDAALKQRDVRYLIIPPYESKFPKVQEFIASAEARGWKLIRGPEDFGEKFWLYVAQPPGDSTSATHVP